MKDGVISQIPSLRPHHIWKEGGGGVLRYRDDHIKLVTNLQRKLLYAEIQFKRLA